MECYDLNCTDRHGNTALMGASEFGHVRILRRHSLFHPFNTRFIKHTFFQNKIVQYLFVAELPGGLDLNLDVNKTSKYGGVHVAKRMSYPYSFLLLFRCVGSIICCYEWAF